MTELAGFAGTLQADGFSGYNQIYKGGAIREAGCLGPAASQIFSCVRQVLQNGVALR
ncbi:transposase [Mesorhizobium sp. M1300]|uniref:IS66 family transposase n=1 Tax=Mesorhizobium sp. M1300 TaxID=2957077 RepID=UPI00333733C1